MIDMKKIFDISLRIMTDQGDFAFLAGQRFRQLGIAKNTINLEC